MNSVPQVLLYSTCQSLLSLLLAYWSIIALPTACILVNHCSPYCLHIGQSLLSLLLAYWSIIALPTACILVNHCSPYCLHIGQSLLSLLLAYWSIIALPTACILVNHCCPYCLHIGQSLLSLLLAYYTVHVNHCSLHYLLIHPCSPCFPILLAHTVCDMSIIAPSTICTLHVQ